MDKYSKLDLHIHSYASSKIKDGDKEFTKNSTLDNVELLIKKLDENSINLCSITDHNIFDKDMFLKIKEYENKGYSLKKVLPGVELDVIINEKIVHVLCIFSDEQDDFLNSISKNFESKASYTLSD